MNDNGTKAPTLLTRRDLLTRTGLGFVAATAGVIVAGAGRLLFPRVRFHPPTTLNIGKPENFAVGEISERWKKSHQVIVVREETGFYALRSSCTHLGCVPSWKPGQKKFKCFCHGSGFRLNGDNFEGPAPRPLERVKIFLNEEGELMVDTAVRFRKEKGEWERAGAYLRFDSNT